MTIQVRGHLKATDAIRQHIDRRLESALGRFETHVRTVTVWLEDVNGPHKGGADKLCKMKWCSILPVTRHTWWRSSTPTCTRPFPMRPSGHRRPCVATWNE